VVEIRRIEPAANLPVDSDWALIERVRGKVAAKGSFARRAKASFGPMVFADLDSALGALKLWAQQNDVPVIYLKEAA
jgi:hypothetical protein